MEDMSFIDPAGLLSTFQRVQEEENPGDISSRKSHTTQDMASALFGQEGHEDTVLIAI